MLERDLHDGVQLRLVAVRIGLGLVSELASGDASLREMLDEIGESVEAAIEELREVAHGIYPQVLSDHGLVAALRHVSRAAGGSVTVRGTGVSRHPAELESAIYDCCREAIQNASKHGGPPVQISISLHEDTRNVGCEEPDDGPGSDLAEASAGAGLQQLRDRLGALAVVCRSSRPPGVHRRLRCHFAPVRRPSSEGSLLSCSDTARQPSRTERSRRDDDHAEGGSAAVRSLQPTSLRSTSSTSIRTWTGWPGSRRSVLGASRPGLPARHAHREARLLRDERHPCACPESGRGIVHPVDAIERVVRENGLSPLLSKSRTRVAG